MNQRSRTFFHEVFVRSTEFIASLPLSRDPPTIDDVTTRLTPLVRLACHHATMPEPGPGLEPELLGADRAGGVPGGLNTVGLLLDRLTILAIKQWSLRSRVGNQVAADQLVAGEAREIIEALAQVRPGLSSLTEKITRHATRVPASDFRRSYLGLLSTNILLWESQEVLYLRDLAALPCEEVKAYVVFFSRENLVRSAYTAACERTFWSVVGGEGRAL